MRFTSIYDIHIFHTRNFLYRFSQLFIDIREKERKRLQRGLVSIPPKYPKLNEKLLGDANDTDENAGSAINRDENPSGFKPEHLLELQEKITKEILSTKLQESEMQELQVCVGDREGENDTSGGEYDPSSPELGRTCEK